MRKYNGNPKNFPGLRPKPHQGSALDRLRGSQCPPNPQLTIAIAARSFSQNNKKNRPANNFSLFRPLTSITSNIDFWKIGKVLCSRFFPIFLNILLKYSSLYTRPQIIVKRLYQKVIRQNYSYQKVIYQNYSFEERF